MPKVSVIIPIYGVENYIERCARSLFEQTLNDIEFIFVDDCTPDNSMVILSRLIDEYKHRFTMKNWVIRTERMPLNSGLPAVRRHGIQLATGDYIIHCDSDDWVDKGMYQALYDSALSENADMVVCDYISTDGHDYNKCVKGCRNTNINNFIIDSLFQKAHWALWNKLFRRELYQDDISYPIGNSGEDMALTSQLLLKCKNIAYVAKPLYYYFYNSESITKKLTLDNIVKNYGDSKANTDIVLDAYKGFKDRKISSGLLYIQYNAKAHIFPIAHISKYRRIFIKTYSGLFWKMLFNFDIPWQCKAKYLIALVGLYPRKANKKV